MAVAKEPYRPGWNSPRPVGVVVNRPGDAELFRRQTVAGTDQDGAHESELTFQERERLKVLNSLASK